MTGPGWGPDKRGQMGLAGRLVQIAVLLPAIALAMFALLHAQPGGLEARLLVERPEMTRERVAEIEARRGLDRPVVHRFGCWLVGRREGVCRWWSGGEGVLFGDLGWSRAHGRAVAELLGERLGRTLAVVGPAVLIALALALGFGVWGAREKAAARWVEGAAALGLAAPLHWVALLAVLGFGVELGWLPTSGIEDPRAPGWASRWAHAVLPVSVMALYFACRWVRHVQVATAEALAAPFAQALRAHGLSEAAVARRALRSAIVPVVAVVSHALPALFSGSVVIERVFVYPGMGTLLLDAVLEEDHSLAAAALFGYAAATLGATLVGDLALRWLDPRLRGGGLG